MDSNISMVRFLMFMILALIIFFNIAPQLVADDKNGIQDNGGNSEKDDDEV
jgi:hypothetical protein